MSSAPDADLPGQFWVVQGVNTNSITPYGVAQVDLPSRYEVIDSIAAGGAMDKISVDWNDRLLGLITSNRMTAALAMSGKTGVEAEKMLKSLARVAADEKPLPIRVPLRFLHIPPDRQAEVDIHERIVFHMLHTWASVSQEDRQHFLKSAMPAQGPMTKSLVDTELCNSGAERLLELIFRARGQHLANIEGRCPTPERHGVENRTVVRAPHNMRIGRQCACGYDHYLSPVYRQWHQRGVGTGVAALLSQVECGTTQAVIIMALLAVWEGLRTAQLTRRMRAMTRKIDIRISVPADTHPLLNDTGAPLLLDCNYQPLRQFLAVLQWFTSGESQETFEKGFTMPLDGSQLRLFPINEPTLTRWFDVLRGAYIACKTYPRAVGELQGLLRGWDNGETANVNGGLHAQVLATGLSFIYYRHINVSVVLADEQADVTSEDATWMTFGITTIPDTLWAANCAKVEILLAALTAFRGTVQKRLQDELLAEAEFKEATRKRKGRKSKEPAPWLPPALEPIDDDDMPPLSPVPVTKPAIPTAAKVHRLEACKEDRPFAIDELPLHFLKWKAPQTACACND